MKTNKKSHSTQNDRKLFNLFKEVLGDDTAAEEAVKDAKKTFMLVRQDAIFKQTFNSDEP